MNDPVYTSFRQGPSYRAADAHERFAGALTLPKSVTDTFLSKAKTEALKTYGLGTAIRDFTIPKGRDPSDGAPAAPALPQEDEKTLPPEGTVERALRTASDFLPSLALNPFEKTYNAARDIAQTFINDPTSPALDEEAYKKSPYFRTAIPWDASMTEDRAAALASSYDAQQTREFFAEKRPIVSFMASFAGQAVDPINYIPIAGPTVRAAAILKMGKIGGTAAFGALDAAANTALFGLATAQQRARYGDDVSWQATVSDIAMAALIGSAFGAAGGAWKSWSDKKSTAAAAERMATLKRTYEARIALNEGIDALVRDVDVALSPTAIDAVQRASADVTTKRPMSSVGSTMRERLVAAGRSDVEATASARIIDDAYTTFADRAGMTVEELADVMGLPVVRAESGASGRVADFSPSQVPSARSASVGGTTIPYVIGPSGAVELGVVKGADGTSARAALGAFLEQADRDNVAVSVTPERAPSDAAGVGEAKAEAEAASGAAPGDAIDVETYRALGFEEGPDGKMVRQPRPNRVLFQTASVRRGEETLKRYGLEPGKRYNTREVAAALEARQRRKYGTIDRGDYSKEASNRIASWMVEEIMLEVELAEANPSKSAVGWYSTKYQTALDELGAAFPEFRGDMDAALPGVALLKTQKNARDFFTALMAITSDGAKVADNFKFAADAYEAFRQTGRVNADVTFGGDRNTSMRTNIANIQRVLDAQGPDNMSAFLLRKDTVSNLKKLAKEHGEDLSTAYKADTELPYSTLVFGPKLGAFYANLMGDTGYLTMDRWWSRTFNRYRGTLLTQPTRQGMERFKKLVAKDRTLNTAPEDITDDEALSMLADYVKSYAAKGYKNGTDIERAANTLYKAAFEGIEDRPFNASDRAFMISTTMLAQKKLKRKGVDLTVADIQAVLWYYEKRLYGQLGARQTQDISYEEIARKVATRRDTAGGPADEVDGASRGEGTLDVGAAGDTAPAIADDATDEPFGDVEGSPRSYLQSEAVGDTVATGVYEGRGGTIPVNANGRVEIRHYSHLQLDEIDPAARGTGPLRGRERERLGPKTKPGEPSDPDVVDRSYFGTGTPPTKDDIAALFAARRAAQKLPVSAGKDENGVWRYPRHEAEQAAFFKFVHQRGYAPEGGLGKYEHIADVDPATLYNVREDPLDLRSQTDKKLAAPERDTQFERLVRDAGFKGMYYAHTELGQIVVMFEKVKPTAIKDWHYDLPLDEIAKPADFDTLTPETFQKGGWGIVTATQEALGPPDSAANIAANDKLRRELKRSGLTFVEVGGAYQGVDQGPSFLVFAPEARVAELGKKYKQESILTRKGLEYGDGSLVPVDPAKTVVGDAAAAKDFYSTMPDGQSFHIGLDFSKKTPPTTRSYQQPLTSSPAFQRWFAGSKVVDANGAPLVLYHGTSKDTDFKAFKTGRRGAWFITDPKEASAYALENDSQNFRYENGGFVRTNTKSRVFPVYLSIKNPKVMTEAEVRDLNSRGENYAKSQGAYFDQLKSEGYDGVNFGGGVWVAFEPTQIKSVNNSGAFDPGKPDILKQSGARGSIEFDASGASVITLFEKADASTVVHETGHFFLNMLRTLAERSGAPDTLRRDWQLVRDWWYGNADAIAADIRTVSPDDVRVYLREGTTGNLKKDAAIDTGLHEQWARGFESYLRSGIAPTEGLRSVFQQFKDWLTKIYLTARDLNVNMTPEITGVFDRMLGGVEAKPVDATVARADPVPEGRAAAEANLLKTEDYKAMAAQYRVDPETGSFAEELEVAQLETEGRLTEDDLTALAESKAAYEDGAAYGEALKAAVGCLI